MSSKTFTIIFTVVAFAVGSLFYLLYPTPQKYEPTKEELVVCTMEAKLCPDGSYVGREGPNCEFHCPAEALCEGGEPCPIVTPPPGAVMEDGAVLE